MTNAKPAPPAPDAPGGGEKSPWPHVVGVVLFTGLGALLGAIPGCGVGLVVGMATKGNSARGEAHAFAAGLAVMAAVAVACAAWAFLRAYARAAERYAYEQAHVVHERVLPSRSVVLAIAAVALASPALIVASAGAASPAASWAMRVVGAAPLLVAVLVVAKKLRPRTTSSSARGQAMQRVPHLRRLVAPDRQLVLDHERAHDVPGVEIVTLVASSCRPDTRRVRRRGRVETIDASTFDWTLSVGLVFVDHGATGFTAGRVGAGDGATSVVDVRPADALEAGPSPPAVGEAQARDPRLSLWFLPGVIVALRPALSSFDADGMSVFVEELRRLGVALGGVARG